MTSSAQPRQFQSFTEITSFIWSVADLLWGDYKQGRLREGDPTLHRLRRLRGLAAYPRCSANRGKARVTASCWAGPFGGCSGDVSREHLVTESLFEPVVRVESQNAPFFPKPSVTTPVRNLVANVLCRGHNQELGRTADWAANRLLHYLRQSNTPTDVRGSNVPRLPAPRRVSSVNFARWLCKTHCNLMIASGMVPSADYARYAFLKPTSRRLYFLLVGAENETTRFGDSRDAVVQYSQFVCDQHPEFDACEISLSGLKMAVARSELLRNGQHLLDRVLRLNVTTPLGPYSIVFDWSGEPSVATA